MCIFIGLQLLSHEKRNHTKGKSKIIKTLFLTKTVFGAAVCFQLKAFANEQVGERQRRRRRSKAHKELLVAHGAWSKFLN